MTKIDEGAMTMSTKLFMPVQHAGLTVGHPVDGFGFTSREICCLERPEIHAVRIYNSSRGNYSVHINRQLVGEIHYITGGRYLGFNAGTKEIANFCGPDALLKCFAEVAVLHQEK